MLLNFLSGLPILPSNVGERRPNFDPACKKDRKATGKIVCEMGNGGWEGDVRVPVSVFSVVYVVRILPISRVHNITAI
jgi:hypothetical protein